MAGACGKKKWGVCGKKNAKMEDREHSEDGKTARRETWKVVGKNEADAMDRVGWRRTICTGDPT